MISTRPYSSIKQVETCAQNRAQEKNKTQAHNPHILSQAGFFYKFSFKNQLRLSSISFERVMRIMKAPFIRAESYLSLISMTYVVEWAHVIISSHMRSNDIEQEQKRLDFISRQRTRLRR